MKEVAPGVHQIATREVSAFIVQHEGSAAVIDTGTPRMAERMAEAVKGLVNVTDILITHYHLDHIGSLAEVAAATGAKVWAPSGDVHIIKGGGRPPDLEPRGLLGFLMSRMIHMQEQEPRPVDEEVKGGETLPALGGIEVIATPGHTGGHVCYLWPRHGGVLFCGDAAANLVRLDPMPVNEDTGRALESFRVLAARHFEVAVFGHGRALRSRASDRFRSRL